MEVGSTAVIKEEFRANYFLLGDNIRNGWWLVVPVPDKYKTISVSDDKVWVQSMVDLRVNGAMKTEQLAFLSPFPLTEEDLRREFG